MQTVLAKSKVIAGYQLLAHGLQSTLPVLACENIRFSSLFVAWTSLAAKSEEKRMFSQAIPVLGPEILLLLSITDFQTESFGFYKTSKFDVVQWCVKVYQSQTAGFSNIPFSAIWKCSSVFE